MTVLRWPGRHHQAEVRAGKRQFFRQGMRRRNRFGTGGKPLAITVGRRQPGVGRGHVLCRKAIQGCFPIDGPQKTMRGMLNRVQKKTARRRHHRKTVAPGNLPQGVCRGQRLPGKRRRHPNTGCMPAFEQIGHPGQDHQALRPVGQGRRQAEGTRHVTGRQQAAEVAVAGRVGHQANRPAATFRIGDLGPHDGCKAFTPAGGQKRPQSVKVVGVRQGQARVAHTPRRAAQPPDGGRPPHEGIMGSDGQRHHTGRKTFQKIKLIFRIVSHAFPARDFEQGTEESNFNRRHTHVCRGLKLLSDTEIAQNNRWKRVGSGGQGAADLDRIRAETLPDPVQRRYQANFPAIRVCRRREQFPLRRGKGQAVTHQAQVTDPHPSPPGHMEHGPGRFEKGHVVRRGRPQRPLTDTAQPV